MQLRGKLAHVVHNDVGPFHTNQIEREITCHSLIQARETCTLHHQHMKSLEKGGQYQLGVLYGFPRNQRARDGDDFLSLSKEKVLSIAAITKRNGADKNNNE